MVSSSNMDWGRGTGFTPWPINVRVLLVVRELVVRAEPFALF